MLVFGSVGVTRGRVGREGQIIWLRRGHAMVVVRGVPVDQVRLVVMMVMDLIFHRGTAEEQQKQWIGDVC